jgi:hypothetical protein
MGSIAKLPYKDVIIMVANKIRQNDRTTHVKLVRLIEMLGLRGVIHCLTEMEEVCGREKELDRADTFFMISEGLCAAAVSEPDKTV